MNVKKINLKKVKKVHFVGIEGAGTSALARIFKFMGMKVTGSDEGDHFYNDVLSGEGIRVNQAFNKKNIPEDVDLIVYSSAFNSQTNPELAAAFFRKNKPISYAEALGILFNEKMGIAVSGTHGKTTTTALLGYILKNLAINPTVLVGSKVPQFLGNSLIGASDYFVLEADEYQNKLQHYNPFAVILTSVDWDHPDYFPTFKEYKKVFSDFVARIPKHGFLVVWGDSADTNEVACSAQCEIIKYGFLEDNDVIIKRQEIRDKKQVFKVEFGGKDLGEFEIQLVGDHNMLNAAAAIAVCYKLNLDMEKVHEAARNFQGTSRRFEYVGEHNGAILIDDYAHHPEEIKATLKAARQIYPEKNIITIFHPHTFTRTKALLSEFSQSFNDTDKIIVIDIYGSAREVQGGVSSKDLVDLINKYDNNKAEYISTANEVMDYLKDRIGESDVVISMGAGDVWRVTSNLQSN
jgi:UDP-N-acetylmuramate--alanine ligase